MKHFYRKHGKWIRAVAFIAVFLVTNQLLTQYVVPAGLTRFILHEVEDEQQNYQVVIFGESLVSYGIDTETLESQTGKKTMQVSIGGEYMMDMYYLVQEMYKHQTPETVIIDIDHTYWKDIPLKENTVTSTLVYNNYPASFRKLSYFNEAMMNKEYRAVLFPWMNYRDHYSEVWNIFKTKNSEAYRNYDASLVKQGFSCDTYKGKGFIYRDRTFLRDENAKVQITWDETQEDTISSAMYLKKIISVCKDKGSKVIMMSMPMNTETILMNQESIDAYNQIHKYFQKQAEDNQVEYYDFNLVRTEQYERSAEDYWDYNGHMYGDAAGRFSKMLGTFFWELEKQGIVEQKSYFYEDVSQMVGKIDINK